MQYFTEKMFIYYKYKLYIMCTYTKYNNLYINRYVCRCVYMCMHAKSLQSCLTL